MQSLSTGGNPQTLSGKANGPGGAGFVRLHLIVDGDRIAFATWESNGCPAAHKASNGLATFLRGRTLEQASKIDPDDLLIFIGCLPDGKGQYATVAVDALKDALQKAMRWIASAPCIAEENFRTLKGHKELWMLTANLDHPLEALSQ
jgi:NifU-like protein involved in Fe-S cluster formation